MMRSFTNIEQSKKLAKILPPESADMYYDRYGTPIVIDNIVTYESIKIDKYQHLIPCWNLSTLLKIIPKRIKEYNVLRIDIGEEDFSIWYDEIGSGVNNDLPDVTKESAIDACYEMILKLKELKYV